MLEKLFNFSFFTKKLLGFRHKMDQSEAKLILNIKKTDLNSIDQAYKKQIILFHPDNKGSDFICTKINEAKEILLKKNFN